MLLAVGDIHGCSNALRKLLPVIEKADKVIFLGDYIDRGPDSVGVLKIVTSLPNAILLRGNHEEMSMTDFGLWRQNGARETLMSYAKHGLEHDHYHDLFRSMPLVHKEVTEAATYYFVHAGFLPRRPLEEQYQEALEGDSYTALWTREHTKVDNIWSDGVVVCGHTPLSEAYISRSLICIDTAAVFKGKLTAISLPVNKGDEMKLYQSVDTEDPPPGVG